MVGDVRPRRARHRGADRGCRQPGRARGRRRRLAREEVTGAYLPLPRAGDQAARGCECEDEGWPQVRGHLALGPRGPRGGRQVRRVGRRAAGPARSHSRRSDRQRGPARGGAPGRRRCLPRRRTLPGPGGAARQGPAPPHGQSVRRAAHRRGGRCRRRDRRRGAAPRRELSAHPGSARHRQDLRGLTGDPGAPARRAGASPSPPTRTRRSAIFWPRSRRGRASGRCALQAIRRSPTASPRTIPPSRSAADNGDARLATYPLVAGTPWLFARPEHDQRFDHLFIDEAGQVALANVVAAGAAARNLVLVGDPMQLAQPVQGRHPGQSAASGLAYILGGSATVAARARHLPARLPPPASADLPLHLRPRLRRPARERRRRRAADPDPRPEPAAPGAGRPALRAGRARRRQPVERGGGQGPRRRVQMPDRPEVSRSGRQAAAA